MVSSRLETAAFTTVHPDSTSGLVFATLGGLG